MGSGRPWLKSWSVSLMGWTQDGFTTITIILNANGTCVVKCKGTEIRVGEYVLDTRRT